jgi:hypothetical protein
LLAPQRGLIAIGKNKTENLHNPDFGSSCFRFCKARVYVYSVEPLPEAPFGDSCLLG